MNKKMFLVIITPFAISIALFALCTAFSFRLDPIKTGGYYQLQSDAFVQKKLGLLISPDPRLLALPNPYDPAQNAPYRIHDLTLFNNRYYLYWGPVPAIVRIIFGNKLPEQFFIYLYVIICSVLYFFIIKYLKNKYFPNINKAIYYITIISGCFNGAVLNLLVSSGIYYESIAAGQAFFLICFLLTLYYLDKPKKSYVLLFSLFSILSIGSRVSYIIPCTFLAFVIFLKHIASLIKRKNTPINIFGLFSVLLYFLPFAIGLLLLGLFNYFRFGNLFEFGYRYQLAGYNMFNTYQKLFSFHNIPANFKNYLLGIPELTFHLPFISQNTSYYPNVERLVFSILLISPITIFIFITHRHSLRLAKLKYFFLFTAFILLLTSSLFSPTSATRYIFDFVYIINITGSIFLYSLMYSLSKRLHKIFTIVMLPLLIVVACFFSIALYLRGIQEYHYQAYLNINTYLYQLTKNPSIIDDSYYINLGLVNNKTKYFIINDRLSGTFGVNVSPLDKVTPKYTKIQDKLIIFRFTSFENEPVNLTLSFIASFNNPKINNDKISITSDTKISHFDIKNLTNISLPLTIKPGFNEIKVESNNIKNNQLSNPPILSDFELFL